MTLPSCVTAQQSYISSEPSGDKRCFHSHLLCSVVPSIGKILMSASEGPGSILRIHGSEKEEHSTENEFAGKGSRAGTLMGPQWYNAILIGMISTTCPKVMDHINPPFLVLWWCFRSTFPKGHAPIGKGRHENKKRLKEGKQACPGLIHVSLIPPLELLLRGSCRIWPSFGQSI